jgi:epoxyqueuosine reductase
VTKSELTTAVKRHAVDLGFDKVGIARAGSLVEEGARLREWLGRGFAGSMAWMERTAEKRADPTLHLESAKSVICVAANYFTPHEHRETPGTGKVSRYAWGDDYHDVVGDRLRALLSWIRETVPEVNAKIAVDSSPVMDKAWAVRAGLGWLGKHSNVITRELGSWVFLGELLVDVEFDYDDAPIPDLCGSCTACIDACPTEAIVAPYVVDSNRCISYLTIELRDETLPLDTHGWLYGCDVCQDVCPWNRFREETHEARFQPRDGLVEPDLDDLGALSQEAFSTRFRGSAMKRTKLRGLVRNALAVSERRVSKPSVDDTTEPTSTPVTVPENPHRH